MTLKELTALLGIEEWPAAYQEEFDRFCEEWPIIRSVPVLDEEAVKTLAEEGFFYQDGVADVLECAKRIDADEALRFACQLLFYSLAVYRGPHQNELYIEPCPMSMGEFRYTFTQVVFVKLLIKGVADARAKGIPEDVLAQQKGVANGDLVQSTGRYGTPGMFHWRAVCSFGTMFHCGVFRFEPERVPPGYRMAKRKTDGKLLMLYTAPVAIDAHGQFARGEEDTAFRTTAATGKLDGYLIAPDGRILNRYLALSAEEWELAFDGGDAALSFHIPPRVPYHVESATDAFEKAVVFYSKYYPEFAWKSLQSYSWLYSPQLRFMLAPTSGIVQMNTNLYLAPVPSGPDGFYEFVFHTDAESFDPATVTTDSSLKRGFVAFVKDGGRVHNGFMYLPFASVDDFREQRADLYATDMLE